MDDLLARDLDYLLSPVILKYSSKAMTESATRVMQHYAKGGRLTTTAVPGICALVSSLGAIHLDDDLPVPEPAPATSTVSSHDDLPIPERAPATSSVSSHDDLPIPERAPATSSVSSRPNTDHGKDSDGSVVKAAV
ncbi:hypothetical protein OE88DRAFT_1740199 [Heliocybe sulcata]|uniref:Uncharacterized protein n=1 Tax=Heliocybe sulcata TaxID=5364 RepID=A0A5C3MLA4_9AGAM|nr:hypothetical protein OE88DRAFT_1740199 [Heliocybe sulcata]